MIKAVIFDLDNTLLDFIKMKQYAVRAAITAMIEAGLEVSEDDAYRAIINLYEQKGWENQQVFNDFLNQTIGRVDIKCWRRGLLPTVAPGKRIY